MSSVLNISDPYFVENNIRYVFIDGSVCSRLDACYVTLKRQLSLPEYFGNNLDALEEVLNDLEWIAEEKVRMIIMNPLELLRAEPEKKGSLLAVLNSCDNAKIEIVYLS